MTKSFKTRDMPINLEREVGLVPGLDTNGLSWIRTFQRRLQLLAVEIVAAGNGDNVGLPPVKEKFTE